VKTGQQSVKKKMKLEQSLISDTQKKLKMDYKPKCKTGQYKTLRGNYRQNTDRNGHNIFLDLSPGVMKILIQINKTKLNLKTFAEQKES